MRKVLLCLRTEELCKTQDIQVDIMAYLLIPTFRNIFRRSYPEIIRFREKHIDRTRVPELNEEDLEEMFVRGSGPGGQAVNKTNNCVVLIHKSSGLVVKCHDSRLQSKNRREARERLVEKLDIMMNNENSVSAQKQRIQDKKSLERKRRQKLSAEMKRAWAERESLD